MATKKVTLPEIGDVHLTKKRGLKTIRLRVDPKGLVKVSVPWLVPGAYALKFVQDKQDWIKAQKQSVIFLPYSGMQFGKSLNLQIIEFCPVQRSRLRDNVLSIYLDKQLDADDSQQIEFIIKNMIRALRTDAEIYILPRIKQLAFQHDIPFEHAKIKQLTGRWGSCDSKGNITLSLFLIQLPWELINYVLIHELAHTIHMNHSPSFWKEVQRHYPDFKTARKSLRTLQPRIYDAKAFM